MRSRLFFALLAVALLPLACAGELDVLGVSNASTVPTSVYAGDVVALTFDVRNVSSVGQVASDLNVSLELNENHFVPISTSEFIKEIRAKGSKTVTMRFQAKEGILPGGYKLSVLVSYKNGATPISKSELVDLTVSACKFLRVEGISLNRPEPHIGEELNVGAVLSNPCSASLHNVTVELKPITNPTIEPFLVTSGTFRKIAVLKPSAREEISFSLKVSDKVEPKTYAFSIDANCDACDKVFSNKFSFRVLGKPELVFSNIDYSIDNAPTKNEKQIVQGSAITLSVQLDNIGEEKAKAVEVETDFGEKIIGTSKAFLGNVDADDSGAAIFNLKVASDAKPGGHKGTITISYTDELGEEQKVVEPYSIFVNEQPPTNPIVYIVILVLVIAALGVIYFIVKFVFRQLAIMKLSR